MFTGIIQQTLQVAFLLNKKEEKKLALKRKKNDFKNLNVGQSIAINGVCLTLSAFAQQHLIFDLLEETLKVTNLGKLKKDEFVNIEQPLRAGDEFGGHFVQGHVDTFAKIKYFEKKDSDYLLKIALPKEKKYIIKKGSIAVDGISLTIAELDEKSFSICITPHTFEFTNLRYARKNKIVNLEFDMLGKYFENYFTALQS